LSVIDDALSDVVAAFNLHSLHFGDQTHASLDDELGESSRNQLQLLILRLVELEGQLQVFLTAVFEEVSQSCLFLKQDLDWLNQHFLPENLD